MHVNLRATVRSLCSDFVSQMLLSVSLFSTNSWFWAKAFPLYLWKKNERRGRNRVRRVKSRENELRKQQVSQWVQVLCDQTPTTSQPLQNTTPLTMKALIVAACSIKRSHRICSDCEGDFTKHGFPANPWRTRHNCPFVFYKLCKH